VELVKHQFKEIMNGFFDGPHATPAPSESGPVFMGIKNIREQGGLDLTNIRHISEEDFPKWTKRVTPRKGDIVFSYEATLHRYALIPEGFHGCLGRRMALIRLNPQKVNNKFLYYYFLSPYWRAFVDSNKITGATVDRISIIDFPIYQISLPELAVQKVIASTLSTYDELIDNNNQRINLLEQMAEEIYKEWFVRLRFPGHKQTRIVDGVPDGWVIVPVKVFGKVVTGKTPSKAITDNFNGDIPFIKTPDMSQGIFAITTGETLSYKGACTQNSQFIPENSICVSCIGTAGKIVITTSKSQTNQQINSIILTDIIYREFLYFSLKHMKRIIEAYGATGATMTNLSKGKFESLKLVQPEKKICCDFHRIASNIFDEILILSKKNKILKQTRDLLLPRLMSGKLSVEHLLDSDF
jgi:type I restriction enzyme S subunit